MSNRPQAEIPHPFLRTNLLHLLETPKHLAWTTIEDVFRTCGSVYWRSATVFKRGSHEYRNWTLVFEDVANGACLMRIIDS
jgi:hypothetical protein